MIGLNEVLRLTYSRHSNVLNESFESSLFVIIVQNVFEVFYKLRVVLDHSKFDDVVYQIGRVYKAEKLL